MHSLSDSDLLRVWELGHEQPSWYRALLLLSPLFPQATQHELAELSIGQRNTYLFALREQTLGTVLSAFVKCPHCTGALEFTVGTKDICNLDRPDAILSEYTLQIEGFELKFRLLNSHDLAAISSCKDTISARHLLISRSILQACDQNGNLSIDELPSEVIVALGDHMTECDPLAEIRFNLTCPDCEHYWSATFDIASFLWTEISVRVQDLVSQIHSLALAYGWRESDILLMSPVRRQAYLDMVD